ncbi:MAG: squalene/phytoene synthase family protein [Bacteroidales bacterium]|nr:squalene/phytoene synthase family protein [Bacteroidales bacterium]
MKIRKLDTYSIIQGIDFEAIKDHPNILIAAGFWEEERFQAAKVCYQFMRKIDDLIDNRKALGPITPEERILFADKVNNWIECLNDTSRTDSSMKHVTETINKFKIPSELFRKFAESMIYDISHNGFATYNSFIVYAEGASVAPASIFVHLCCLSKKYHQFISPSFDVIEVARPCALFSYLVHIIRDFQKDQNNNLNYFASDILKKYNLTPEDLKKMAHGKPIAPDFRNVIREYYNYAEIYKQETIDTIEKIKDQLEDRYTLSLYIIFELYLQVFERIDIEKGKFTTEELNPAPAEIKDRVLRVCS